MPNFEAWKTKQREIYDRFARSTDEVEGIIPNIPESQGGYLIILRHSEEISEKAASFSDRISNCVPALTYDRDTIHTTISDYGLSEDFEPDQSILRKLCDAVLSMEESPIIDYTSWLYNPNTVIVAGNPNRQFLEIAEEIKTNAQGKGIELRLPWGAHITANRFTKKKTRNELSDFFKLMQEAPILGKSKPEHLDVGHFKLNKQGFGITTYERFTISSQG